MIYRSIYKVVFPKKPFYREIPLPKKGVQRYKIILVL